MMTCKIKNVIFYAAYALRVGLRPSMPCATAKHVPLRPLCVFTFSLFFRRNKIIQQSICPNWQIHLNHNAPNKNKNYTNKHKPNQAIIKLTVKNFPGNYPIIIYSVAKIPSIMRQKSPAIRPSSRINELSSPGYRGSFLVTKDMELGVFYINILFYFVIFIIRIVKTWCNCNIIIQKKIRIIKKRSK